MLFSSESCIVHSVPAFSSFPARPRLENCATHRGKGYDTSHVIASLLMCPSFPPLPQWGQKQALLRPLKRVSELFQALGPQRSQLPSPQE